MIQETSSLNFKGIHTYRARFNPTQEVIKKDIITKLRTPGKYGETIEDFFEKNRKEGFCILPLEDDKVEFQILKGAKYDKNRKLISFLESDTIDLYDKEHKFDPQPYIEEIDNDKLFQRILYGAVSTVVAIGSVIAAVCSIKN